MDYEKKYKEALERAKDVKNGPCPHDSSVATVEYIFPELRESEDEKVRALLVSLVQWAEIFPQSGLDPDTTNKMLSYLEKQKEQKPAQQNSEEVFNKIDSSFRKGREVGFREGMESARPADWSEKDEKKIHFLSRLIEFQVKDGEYCFGEGACAISKQEAIEMLKSLRPSWKPSEEQMEAFRSVLEHEAERVGSSKHLEKANSLYEQLKKL